MAFFIIIVTDDLAEIVAIRAVFLLFTIAGIGGIDSNDWCGAFVGITISSIFSTLSIQAFSKISALLEC